MAISAAILGALSAGARENDGLFNYVMALLHLDGGDNSTVFTDIKGHTFTPAGKA